VIDLVYRAGDQWQIVDYKTDVGGQPDSLAAKYTGQMRAYESAWRTVTGAKTDARLCRLGGARSSITAVFYTGRG